jgi:hypothetical protein
MRTGFGCTDDSDNVDSIFASSAWCEEDETATEGLLPINQPTSRRNEQSKNLNNRSIDRSIDRAQEWPSLSCVPAIVEKPPSRMAEASKDW